MTPDAHANGTKPRADLSRGRLRLYRAHSVAFLSASNIVHPIMRKSKCWCVDGEATFVLRISGDDYYRIELADRADADTRGAEELKEVLARILMYEKTPCPFARGFTVDLPETPELPAGKRKWRPAEGGSSTPLVEYSYRDLRLAFPEHRSPNAGTEDGPSVGFEWRDGSGTPSRPPPRVDHSVNGPLPKSPRPRGSAAIRSVTVPARFLESLKPPALPSEPGIPPTPPAPPLAEASASRGLGRPPTEGVDGMDGEAPAAQDRPLPDWDRSSSNSPCSPLHVEQPAPEHEQEPEPVDAAVPREAPGPWQVDGSVSDSAADARARTSPRPATDDDKVQELSTPTRQTRVENDGTSDPALAPGAQIPDACPTEAPAAAAPSVDLAGEQSPFDREPTSAGYRSDSRSTSISSAVVFPMVMSSTRPGLSAMGAGMAPSSPDVASARRVLSSLNLSRTRTRSSARQFLPQSPSPSPKFPSTPVSTRIPSSRSSSCSTSFYSTKPLHPLQPPSPEMSSSSSSIMSPVTTTTIILAQRTCSLVFHTSTHLIHTMLSIARRIMDGALRDIFIGFSESGDKIPCQWDFDDSDYDVEDDARGSDDDVAHQDELDADVRGTEGLSSGDEHRETDHAGDDPRGLFSHADSTTDDTFNVPNFSNTATRSKPLTSRIISNSRNPSTIVNDTCNCTRNNDDTHSCHRISHPDPDPGSDPEPDREVPSSSQAILVNVREPERDDPATPKHKSMEIVDDATPTRTPTRTRRAPSARSTLTVNKGLRKTLGTSVSGTDALGTDALGTDALGTDALGTDALGTDAQGTDSLGKSFSGKDARQQQQQQDSLVQRTRRQRGTAPRRRRRSRASSVSERSETSEEEEEEEEAGVKEAGEWTSGSGLGSRPVSRTSVDWALDVD